METNRENFEFALSQYADGTLNELERRVVEDRLVADAEGRLLVSDFARIDALLREARDLPAIDFDALAASISRRIEIAAAPARSPLRMPLRRLAPLAAAAAVAIAALVGLSLHHPGASDRGPVTAQGSAVIIGPHIETASASPAIIIGVGPSDTLAQRGDVHSLGDEAIAPPSPRVVISAAASPLKDDVRPY